MALHFTAIRDLGFRTAQEAFVAADLLSEKKPGAGWADLLRARLVTLSVNNGSNKNEDSPILAEEIGLSGNPDVVFISVEDGLNDKGLEFLAELVTSVGGCLMDKKKGVILKADGSILGKGKITTWREA